MMKKNVGVRRRESGVAVRAGKIIYGLIIAAHLGITLAGCGGSSGGGKKSPSSTPGVINNTIGVGVIMQSRSTMTFSSFNGHPTGTAWKKIDLAPGTGGVREVPLARQTYRAAALDLTDKLALILLVWEKVAGAGHYQVFYQGNKVWDSATVDITKDPAFETNNPQAYLDSDDNGELSGIITGTGQYSFQIKALSGNAVIAQASVTASLGIHLQSLPANIGFSNPNLTWDPVTSVNEYRINFKLAGEDTVTKATVESGTVSYNVSLTLGASTGGRYYDVYFDARYLEGGNPVEISRGIGPIIEL